MEEKTIFVKTFGDYPLIKILDFLIYSRDYDYPITEIAKNSNVNFQTLKKIWPKLEKEKTVVKTRRIKGMNLYKINTENPVAKKLIKLNNDLIWEQTNKKEIKI